MHDALGMYCAQSIHDRNKDLGCLFPVKLSAVLTDIYVKTGTFDKVHYEVRSSVFFKICMNTDYIFISDELRKGLSFIKETVFTIIKAGATLTCKR